MKNQVKQFFKVKAIGTVAGNFYDTPVTGEASIEAAKPLSLSKELKTSRLIKESIYDA